MKKYRNVLVLVVVAFVVLSCGDKNPVENDTDNTLPFAVGYKVVFDACSIDDAGNKGYAFGRDSMVCYKEEVKDGKDALFFEMYYEDGSPYDAEIYSLTDSIIYLHSDFIDLILYGIYDETGFLMPFKPNKDWIEFINFNADSWTIADEKIEDFNMRYNYATFANGNLVITGKYEGEEEITHLGSKYTCKKYLLSTKFDGTITDTTEKMSTDLKADISIVQYISPKLGKVRTLYKSSNIKMGYMDMDVFGYGTFLVGN